MFDPKTITAQLLLTPFRIHSRLDDRKRALQAAIRNECRFQPNDVVLIDGVYHVLNAVHSLLELTGGDVNDANAGILLIDKAIEVVANAVMIEEADPAFSLSKFFKDGKTAKKVHDAARAATGSQGS